MRQAGRPNALLLVVGIAYFVDLFFNWGPGSFLRSGVSGWEIQLASSTGPIALGLVLVESLNALGIWRTKVSSLLGYFLSAAVGVLGISAIVLLRWGSYFHFKFSDFGYGAWIGLCLAIILLAGGVVRLRDCDAALERTLVAPADPAGRVDQLLLFAASAYFLDLFLRWFSAYRSVLIGHVHGWNVPVASFTGYSALGLVLVEIVRQLNVWRTSSSALLAFILGAGTASLAIASVIDLHWGAETVKVGDYNYGAWVALALAAIVLVAAFGLLSQLRRREIGISDQAL